MILFYLFAVVDFVLSGFDRTLAFFIAAFGGVDLKSWSCGVQLVGRFDPETQKTNIIQITPYQKAYLSEQCGSLLAV